MVVGSVIGVGWGGFCDECCLPAVVYRRKAKEKHYVTNRNSTTTFLYSSSYIPNELYQRITTTSKEMADDDKELQER